MRAAADWKDYELIDASGGERLERWGDVTLVRPDPQVIWKTEKKDPRWYTPDAVYHRSSAGGGAWEYKKRLPESWEIGYKKLRFSVSPTGFKHTGIFPEQAVNWDEYERMIKGAGRTVNVLNLFAYTGGATLACLSAGASVCHVDAAKGMVAKARGNAQLSGLSSAPVRWIVDDCFKFVSREIKRGVRYDAVIMDPPSYGRGPNGEVWKLEEELYGFMELCCKVLSREPLFVAVNSYTTGISSSAIGYALSRLMPEGDTCADEIGLPVTASGDVLPCGGTALWRKRDI